MNPDRLNKAANLNKSRRAAVLVAAALLLLSALSLFLLLLPQTREAGYIADIYQNGVLLQSIDLSQITESYTFTVTGENGCTNEIAVRPGSIGILSADCPDRLCVRQGFISNSLLPITCLPNRLVIQLRSAEQNESEICDLNTY